jgi:DnaK suppressor protein
MATLSTDELAILENTLQAEYRRLVDEVREELARSGEQHYIDLAGRVTDLGDESVADALADLDAAIIDRHIREMRQIEATQARIKAGQYGDCGDCGQPIGFNRLKVYPTAERCIDCQVQHEKQYAQESRPSL